MSIYTKYKEFPRMQVIDTKDLKIDPVFYLVKHDLEILAVTNFLLETGRVDVVGVKTDSEYKIYNFTNVNEWNSFSDVHSFPLICDIIVMTNRNVIKNVDLNRFNDDFESVVEHCRRNNDHILPMNL